MCLRRLSHAICCFNEHSTAQMICLPLDAIVVVLTLHTSGIDTQYQKGPDSGHLPNVVLTHDLHP